MTNVPYFVLACLVSDVVDLRWCIILTKLVETEVEELFGICIRIEPLMFPRISAASVVAHINIEAFTSQLKRH